MRDLRRAEKFFAGRGSNTDDLADSFSRDDFKKFSKKIGRRKEAMRDLRRAERRAGRGQIGRRVNPRAKAPAPRGRVAPPIARSPRPRGRVAPPIARSPRPRGRVAPPIARGRRR